MITTTNCHWENNDKSSNGSISWAFVPFPASLQLEETKLLMSGPSLNDSPGTIWRRTGIKIQIIKGFLICPYTNVQIQLCGYQFETFS